MRNNENNIIFNVGNMTLNLKNITTYFTGKDKIITLCFTILMLSFVNIILCFSNNFVSALSYESEIGIGFTFNPTLSISLSSSDLIIPNLTPGSSENSNNINVSVATNASYGYTLSVNANSDYLTHSNNVNTFNSVAIDADLANLTTDNTWGYSTSLDNGSSWSNYNGLSSFNSAALLDKDNNTSSNVDFKIAAKAGNTQPSGTYTNTITFVAATKPTPMNLAESYFAAGKSRYKGYYTMQDMTTEICANTEVIGEGSQTQLIDIRDDKVYWATKLADNHCWMTQNLDLDLSHDAPLTSETTDLNDSSLSGAYGENYAYDSITGIITWTPANTTRDNINNIGKWGNSYDVAYSYSDGDWYWSGDYDSPNCNYLNTTCEDFSQIPYNTIGTHGHVGNLYNWSAVIASNNSSSLDTSTRNGIDNNPENSICPKNWRLPTTSNQNDTLVNSTNEFSRLNRLYNDGTLNSDAKLIIAPLYFVRAGFRPGSNNILYNSGSVGVYYSSTISNSYNACYIDFTSNIVRPDYDNDRRYGRPVRCVAK